MTPLSKTVIGAIVFGLIFFSGNGIALSPTDLNSDLMIVQGNTLIANSTLDYSPKTMAVRGFKLVSDYYHILARYDWDLRTANAVLMAESGDNPRAENEKDYHRKAGCWGSYGLMQMGCVHFGSYGLTWENKFNPEANIHAAYLLYKERGWKPWGAYNDGSYLAYY